MTRSRGLLQRIAVALLTIIVAAAMVALVSGCTGGGGSGANNTTNSTSTSNVTNTTSNSTSNSTSSSNSTSNSTHNSTSNSTSASNATSNSTSNTTSKVSVKEDGTYTSKDEVALYIHTYGHLPSNFISKTKARNAGWDADAGNLDEVCPGKSIGGSQFNNDDGLLPSKKGRTWTECDINYHGGYRGAERIVFSNDGLIYYTGDHYKTFEQLY